MSAFKKKRRLRDLKPRKKAKKKTTFESVVEKVMRIREEEKRNSVKRKKSTSSNTTISSTITSTSISSTTSDQFKPNQRPKRPESVAQRVLRERKEKKISTKVPQTSASQRPKTSSAKAKRQPLHVALRQSASKHGSRAVRAEKIKEQVHFNAVKDFQVFLLVFTVFKN